MQTPCGPLFYFPFFFECDPSLPFYAIRQSSLILRLTPTMALAAAPLTAPVQIPSAPLYKFFAFCPEALLLTWTRAQVVLFLSEGVVYLQVPRPLFSWVPIFPAFRRV